MSIPERASEAHEKEFRATYALRPDLVDESYWEAAYEYAASYKLTLAEMDIVGAALVRRETT